MFAPVQRGLFPSRFTNPPVSVQSFLHIQFPFSEQLSFTKSVNSFSPFGLLHACLSLTCSVTTSPHRSSLLVNHSLVQRSVKRETPGPHWSEISRIRNFGGLRKASFRAGKQLVPPNQSCPLKKSSQSKLVPSCLDSQEHRYRPMVCQCCFAQNQYTDRSRPVLFHAFLRGASPTE